MSPFRHGYLTRPFGEKRVTRGDKKVLGQFGCGAPLHVAFEESFAKVKPSCTDNRKKLFFCPSPFLNAKMVGTCYPPNHFAVEKM